jgi:pyruvate/2-oxoacid:ferredoxin oxidoreductase alpha subunit/pyruvate/2-oxoacid:ferredoxin oxidoreductase beta subunit
MKKIMTGNKAAVWGAMLARAQVLPEYEITPSTSISEGLAKLCAKGEMKAIYIPVESEHSAMAAAIGASYAGARTFQNSCSHGLALMHEMLHTASGMRLPIVMVVPNRAMGLPWNIWTDQNDSLSQRDTGWLQLYCENAQEVLDTVLMAFKIAENIMLPIMVVAEGFVLSHTAEPVEAPSQKLVDKFLPPYCPGHKLSLKKPRALAALVPQEPYFKMRIDAKRAMEGAKKIIKQTDKEFGKIFNRNYGVIEKFHWHNPKIALVTSGTITSTVRHILLNEKGFEDIGLLKIKAFRPFPDEDIIKSLKDVEKVAVIDRNISLGSGGIFCSELKSALSGPDSKPRVFGFITGLGGVDVTPEIIKESITYTKKHDLPREKIIWLPKGIEKTTRPKNKKLIHSKKGELVYSGHSACQGCGLIIGLKHTLKALGHKTFGVFPAGCSTLLAGIYPQSTVGIPCCHVNFAAGAPSASGIKAALKIQGIDDVENILVWAGDGATYDIGFGALSGAAERGDDIIYVCANNEAYMNTGTQRSSATPFGAWTTTTPLPAPKSQAKKPIVEIMAAHRIPYASTASIAFPDDLKRKIEKAKSIKGGLKFIEILCPCPTGWRFSSELTIKLARLAVWTGIFPLYEIENGEKRTINFEPEFLPIEEYLKIQERFSHLAEKDIAEIQKNIHKEWRKLKILSYISFA